MINWKSFKNRSNDNVGWSVPSDPFERLMFHLEWSLIPINHPFCIKIPYNTVYRSEYDVRSIGYCTIRAYNRINWWITWPESEKVLSPYWGLSKWFLINPLSSLSSIAVFLSWSFDHTVWFIPLKHDCAEFRINRVNRGRKGLHRCWWRMLETKFVGESYKMLVTVLAILVTNIHFFLFINSGHQHSTSVTNLKWPTSRCHEV